MLCTSHETSLRLAELYDKVIYLTDVIYVYPKILMMYNVVMNLI